MCVPFEYICSPIYTSKFNLMDSLYVNSWMTRKHMSMSKGATFLASTNAGYVWIHWHYLKKVETREGLFLSGWSMLELKSICFSKRGHRKRKIVFSCNVRFEIISASMNLKSKPIMHLHHSNMLISNRFQLLCVFFLLLPYCKIRCLSRFIFAVFYYFQHERSNVLSC